jgi:hypothetical protein
MVGNEVNFDRQKHATFFGFIFGLSRFGNGEQADWMNVRLLFSWAPDLSL